MTLGLTMVAALVVLAGLAIARLRMRRGANADQPAGPRDVAGRAVLRRA